MMRLQISACLIVLLLAASPVFASEHGPSVAKLTSGNFEEVTKDGKVHFVKFFAPWCGHCKKLAPSWTELADGFKDSDKIAIASVDCTQHQEICKSAEIKGYPTLKVFFNGEAQGERYGGARSLDAMKDFITKEAHRLLDLTTA